MPSLPYSRAAGGLVLVDRELHFFGGIDYYQKSDTSNHWVFNIDNGVGWSSRAALPNPRNHFGYTELGGKIYAVGGQHVLGQRHSNLSDVHVYDLLSNTWTKVASLPIPTSHIHTSTFVRNGKIDIIGGLTNGTSYAKGLANVTEYDPKSNKWVALPAIPDARKAPAAKLINNQIIVSGGDRSGPKTTTWIGVPK